MGLVDAQQRAVAARQFPHSAMEIRVRHHEIAVRHHGFGQHHSHIAGRQRARTGVSRDGHGRSVRVGRQDRAFPEVMEVGREGRWNQQLAIRLGPVQQQLGLVVGDHPQVELVLVQPGGQALDDLPAGRPGVLVDHGDGEMPQVRGGIQDAAEVERAERRHQGQCDDDG